MKRKIIAIIDTLANDFAGPLTLHTADASAVRYFSDVALHPESHVGRHIKDYTLVELGTINEDMQLEPTGRTVITGSQWAAAQQSDTNSTEK